MLVAFPQPADGTVTYLAHPLALQSQILGYLGHRLMLTVQTEEAVDDLRLTLAQRESRLTFERPPNGASTERARPFFHSCWVASRGTLYTPFCSSMAFSMERRT